MQILEKGTLPTHEFKCSNCGTRFIAEGNEFHVKYGDTIEDELTGICGEVYYHEYIATCPLCGHECSDYHSHCYDTETWFDKLCNWFNKLKEKRHAKG